MKEKNPERKPVLEENTKQAREPKEDRPQSSVTVEEPIVADKIVPPAAEPSSAGKERRFRDTNLPAHFIERRKHPRISTQQPPPPAPPRLDDYAAIIGQPELDEIRFLARHLRGKTVKMV